MNTTYKYLFILLTLLPATLLAQQTDEYDNDNIVEVTEIKLNDSYTVRLKQIHESEYITRKNESEHLRQKPYKVVTDLEEAQKILGRKLRLIEVKEEGGGSYCEFDITFKNGNKQHLSFEFGFIAYYPELKILLFTTEGGYYSVDFENNLIEEGVSPEYHFVSPDKQLRINAECPNNLAKEDFSYFIEKWNKSRKKYEYIGDLFSVWGDGVEWSWTSNQTALCTYIPTYKTEEDREYYEMEIIAKENN